MSLQTGTKIGAYEIIGVIGKGGMGEVYRARDPRLSREVAIKVLPESLLREENALLRFEHEARTLASLSHPNVLTIYDVVLQADGLSIVTELLKGETLRERLKRESIPLAEAIRVANAIAEGLAAGHAQGIIHRDLKPENIFLTSDGQTKILDFGLARVESKAIPPAESWMDTSPALSQPGAVLGTLRSMPPEQLRGQTADVRADIYAVGVILYEMVAGHLPFQASDPAELTASILRDPPQSIEDPGVPARLIDLIFRCLEKDPDQRFASIRDLLTELKSISIAELSSVRPRTARGGSRGRGKSVAILPISHSGDDPEDEYLMDGITESIINTVSQLPKLKVTARSTAFRYKGKEVDPVQIGKALGVRTLLSGRGVRRADRLDIQVELVNTEDGSQMWGQHFGSNLSDVFSVQEEIARQISSALHRRLTGAEKKMLSKRYTEDIEAYKLYLKGRHHWNKRTPEGFQKAIEFYQQAIEADPAYALAYTGLADCYNFLGWEAYGLYDPKVMYPRAIAAATKALQIDQNLAEAYNSLAWVKWSFQHDWEGAEKDYLRAIELNPGYALAHVWYADLLAGCGKLEAALEEIRIAQNLDPLAPVVYAVHGLILYFMKDYSASREEAAKAIELHAEFIPAYAIIGRALEFDGKSEEAIDVIRKAASLSANHPRMVAFLAHAYASAGKLEEARNILNGLIAQSKEKYFPALIDTAMVYAQLRQNDTAFEWLERAYQERAALLVWLYPDPAADPLRSDPRFDDLMRRIGIPLRSL